MKFAHGCMAVVAFEVALSVNDVHRLVAVIVGAG